MTDLVQRAQLGDSHAFDELVKTYRDNLRSYLFRMITHPDETEDLTQETFVKAYMNIQSFRGESSFKTWLFAIGTNLVRDHFRAKRRWPENNQDIGKKACPSKKTLTDERDRLLEEGLNTRYDIESHINFCFTCIMKSIPLEQQIALMLKEIYLFKNNEIAEIMNKTETSVKHLVHNARDKMKRIFNDRCALIGKQGMCYQCVEMHQLMYPDLDPQRDLENIPMVQEAQNPYPEDDHLFNLRINIVQKINPLNSHSSDLHQFLFNITRDAIGDI